MNADARLTVDASVVVKWFVEEDGSGDARRLIRGQRQDFIAPDLLLLEIANAFLKKVRRGEISRAAVETAVNAVPAFVRLLPSMRLFDEALELAFRHQCAIYDSVYVALALGQGCQFITADERLYNGLRPHFGETMLWLGDLPPA